MSRFFQDHPAGGFRLASPVKLPVASETPRCAPPHTFGAGRNHAVGGGQIGTLAAGALADVLLVDGDPTQSVAMWADPATGIRLLMQGGRIVRSSLA